MSKRDYILQTISDLSKDARGYRVRMDYNAMSDKELEDTYQQFLHELEESHRQDCIQKLWAQQVWERYIDSMVQTQGISRATALRWDMEAHDVDGDVGFYCYHYGLDYDLEARIKEELNGGTDG